MKNGKTYRAPATEASARAEMKKNRTVSRFRGAETTSDDTENERRFGQSEGAAWLSLQLTVLRG